MTTASPVAPTGRQWGLGLDILVMALITIGSVMFFSAKQVDSIGLVGRLIVPGRMLLLVLVATFLMRRRGERWGDVGMGRPKRLWATPLLGIGGYVCAYILVGLMVLLLFPVLHLPRPGIGPFGGIKGNLPEYLYWMIPVTWGSAAFGEEMLFRGFFFTRLLKLLPPTRTWAAIAVVMQAVLFGSLHLYLGMSGALVAGLLGIVLATVYLLGGRNLWASILLHGLIDSTSITLIYLGLAKT
jgi:uncharacterized protein